jgi:hypothetical protein
MYFLQVRPPEGKDFQVAIFGGIFFVFVMGWAGFVANSRNLERYLKFQLASTLFASMSFYFSILYSNMSFEG